MASVNKVILVGNLGRDPETRYMPSGDAMTTISIATTDSWKDKTTGERKETTEWHRVVFFGRLAEVAGQYLKKGSSVYVEGSLRTRKYTDKDGIEKYATDIRADTMQMLGGRTGSTGMDSSYDAQQGMQNSSPRQSMPAQSQQPAAARPVPGFATMEDDDIPF